MMYVFDDRLLAIYHIKDSSGIEGVLRVLNGFGVSLQGVRTRGEHSSHDGTYSFNSEYATYEDFVTNVYRDFEEETERYKSAATVDWSGTNFELSHSTDWNISVFMRKMDECHDYPDTAYLSIRINDPTDEDKALIEEWVAALALYLEQ